MKNFILLVIFLIATKSFCQIDYPQKLTFYKKDVSAPYINQYGKTSYQNISYGSGVYEFSFSRATEVKNSPILDIYGDTDEKGYYAFISTLDNFKMGEKVYEGNIFYSTSLETGVNIYLAFDKSSLIIVTKKKVIRYY